MGLLGVEFKVQPADIDESRLEGESPSDYVSRLAREKACAIAAQEGEGQIFIAADTTVADGEELLGKPKDDNDAKLMLEQLRGRTHEVYTGMAVFSKSANKILIELSCTDVPMRDYTDSEIDEYIASGDPFDKAGGYAIQHQDFHPVEKLNGCYANVMGLPLCHLSRTLKQFGIELDVDVAKVCQQELDYNCDIYGKVLEGEL